MRTTIEIVVCDLDNENLKRLIYECIEELGSRIEGIPESKPKMYGSIKEIGSKIKEIPEAKSKPKKKAKLQRGRGSKKEEAELERLKDDFPADRIAKRMDRSLESVQKKMQSTEKTTKSSPKIKTAKDKKKFDEVFYCVMCNQNAVTKEHDMCPECESNAP